MSLPTKLDAFQALDDRHVFVITLMEEYGFPSDAFAGWTFWHRCESDAVWIARSEMRPIPGIPTGAFGMMASKNIAQPTRLSASFIQRFGHLASRSTITLNHEGTRMFAAGNRISWPSDESPRHYSIVIGTMTASNGEIYHVPVGRGRFERGQLCSDVPKAQRFQL